MPKLVDRSMMESVFPPEQLQNWETEKLPAGICESARSVLTDVGLPHDRNSFFLLDGWLLEGENPPNAFRRCAELDYFCRYRDVPMG
jgi:hypothetical protein